jgi:glycosyltransferase involved in cell wall biosynthesis
VEHLKDEFEFYIVTRDTDYCETTPYPNIISDAWNVLPNGAKVYYISSQKLGFKNLVRICKTIDSDLIYINGIYSLYFSLFPLVYSKYFTHKKIVVAGRGMLSDHTFSSKQEKKHLFYAFAKFIGLYNGITFHATNADEAGQIRKNAGFKGEIKVAPNLPPKVNIPFERNITKTPGELRLISIARISPEKNTLFALQVLEKFASPDERRMTTEKSDKIVFDLYGTIYDEPYWNECQQVIHRLPASVNVNFCGPLEKEKVQETLRKYHFLFMPSQGENYGHSVVESMLAGCPVIISDRTPWRNLEEIVIVPLNPPKGDFKEVQSTEISETLNSEPLKGVGWDIPLEHPEQFIEVIKCCTRMGQKEYDAMSQRTFEHAKQVTENPVVVEANRQLFNIP